MEVDMLTRFSNAFDTFFTLQNALETAHGFDRSRTNTQSGTKYPTLDLFKKGDDVILIAEIPGMKKEDIKLEIKDKLLKISGERKATYPEKSSILRKERVHADFQRSLRLPYRVDTEKVEAEYTNGILKVKLPRAEEDKAKEIVVS